jgi:two-component system, OmpR family, sensor histidine kinase KdpD
VAVTGLRRSGEAPWLGAAVGLAAVGATVGALLPFRSHIPATVPALLLVLAVGAAGVLGGPVAAAGVAVVAAACFNLAFIAPFGQLKVDAWEDWVALGVFVAVALVVGLLVAREAERRRAAEAREAEVRSLYERLQQADADRARLSEEVARMEVLKRVDEQRSALLRSVSHDLRSPLATIRAVTTDLRDGVVYEEPTRVELLTTVCDEVERLDRIVANLLSLSRIEAGAFSPERQAVPLDELVGERVRRLKRLFRSVRLQVDLPPDLPLVDGDYTQIELVLTNILENAGRHAPPGSTVRVSARPKADMVEVRIADEGFGVPEWERERIFEPFRRGEGSRSSGVGLAICKAVVEAHGGTIRAERTAGGGGATFVFTLPVRAA